MDAEKPDFDEGTFDAVVSRNLTWTLPDAAAAYREWCRVLKEDGVLLNFDAGLRKRRLQGFQRTSRKSRPPPAGSRMLEECERMKRQLAITSCSRPGWDLEALEAAGDEVFSNCVGDWKRNLSGEGSVLQSDPAVFDKSPEKIKKHRGAAWNKAAPGAFFPEHGMHFIP